MTSVSYPKEGSYLRPEAFISSLVSLLQWRTTLQHQQMRLQFGTQVYVSVPFHALPLAVTESILFLFVYLPLQRLKI